MPHSIHRIVLVLLLILPTGLSVSADVVQLADGREYIGEIVERTDSSVVLRTVIARVPVTLRLAISEKDRIREKKLPESFFSPAKRSIGAPEGKPAAGAGNQYLEIPIRGRIGEDVVAEGVRKSLAHALKAHVGHIIFTIDSGGGEFTEAVGIYELLQLYDPYLTYHAVIARAEGIAMAVPIWCDTIHVRPSGRMGGIETGDVERRLTDEGGELTDDAMVARAAAIASVRGLPGLVVAAMVIPEETVTAWRDEAGEVHLGPILPDGVSAERAIFRDGRETRLTLTGAQAAEIGIAKLYDGELDRLCEALELAGWTPESDHGIRTMALEARAARTDREKTERSVKRWNRDIEKNVKKHREAISYILASIAAARQYDPRKDEFETIKVDTGSVDWFGQYNYNARDTHQFTKDAKKRWKLQTDLTLRALARVRKGLKQIEGLDRRAGKLGIVRDSAAELGQYVTLERAPKLELDTLDAVVRSEMERLARERNKKGN